VNCGGFKLPGAKTYQSDGETVHRLIENEFSWIEDFLKKATFRKCSSNEQITRLLKILYNSKHIHKN
jgi:hypothetical protein